MPLYVIFMKIPAVTFDLFIVQSNREQKDHHRANGSRDDPLRMLREFWKLENMAEIRKIRSSYFGHQRSPKMAKNDVFSTFISPHWIQTAFSGTIKIHKLDKNNLKNLWRNTRTQSTFRKKNRNIQNWILKRGFKSRV